MGKSRVKVVLGTGGKTSLTDHAVVDGVLNSKGLCLQSGSAPQARTSH